MKNHRTRDTRARPAGAPGGHGRRRCRMAVAAGRPTRRSPSGRQDPRLRQAASLTLKRHADHASDKIALRLKAGRPDVLQIDVGDDGSADFSVKRRFVARIAVDARAGDDLVRIDDANGAFTDAIPTTIDGGFGSDNLAGGAGAERLRGGPGTDAVDGNRGNDLALMGSGDDTFTWDPGDGSDTIEGQTGTDTMRFNGAGAAENIDLVGERQPAAVLPRRRQHHHGHQRRRDGRLQRPRRRRHDHRQRPHRHRRRQRALDLAGTPAAAPRRPARPRHRQRQQRQRRGRRRRRRRGCHRVRSARARGDPAPGAERRSSPSTVWAATT